VHISVIVPVFNGAASLTRCLQSLAQSQYAPAECIVVDDGSTDDSAAVAEQFGAVVISTGGPFGPAKARNLGARKAQGDILLFIDADVAVETHALGRIVERFNSDPALDGLIGSYDDSPADPRFVSQFKNLMHAFVHQSGNRQAFSFWCGCGAVKRDVFLEHGGLDEAYQRPSIEDIEFGFRMMNAGRKLVLDPQVRCKHLKMWTFWNLVYTDVFQRGIPWTELILRTGFFPDDLNLRKSQRVSVMLSGLLVLLSAIGLRHIDDTHFRGPEYVVGAGFLACLTAIVMINRSFYHFLSTRKSWSFSLAAVPLHVTYYVYSGLAFGMGLGGYLLRTVPEPAAEILAQPQAEEEP